jgi:PhnB protein
MPKAKPIPDGFHALTPHLICRDAAPAIEFYKKAFGAEEVVRMPGPGGQGIMHAEMRIGDSRFMLAGENPSMQSKAPITFGGTPVTLHLYVEDVDKAFDRAVKAGAKVKMPVTDMFWGDRYGQVTDPSGHQWSIATHMKDMTPAEMGKAAEQFFASMKGGPGKPEMSGKSSKP